MEKIMGVLEIIVPILVIILLGVYAKRTNMISIDENKGLQQFVMKFGLPCVLFNSCLNAQIQAESITTMLLVLPLMLLSAILAFQLRKNKYPYSNFPQLFSAQESGMLGIPLYMTLFGAAQAYRMGVLDLAQSVVAIPVIAILSTNAGENLSISSIVKKVALSPFLIMSVLGLVLNLSGIIHVLNDAGIGSIILETTGFVSQPVSAVILFSVGYNFSIGEGNKKQIFEICALHLGLFALFCVIIQTALFLVPTEVETRWAILLFCTLPSSFLAPTLAKTEEESAIASSVCSLLTVVCLIIFIIMTIFVR